MAKAKPKAREKAKPTTAAKKAPRAPAQPKPQTLTPYLAVNDAARAIEWYKTVLGAKEFQREPAPGNKIMHAALAVGGSQLFLSDIFPGSDMADATRAGATVNLHVTSKDVDKIWTRAVENGAKVTMQLDDMFWGDRYGRFLDPFGHSWAVSWKSKVSKAELDRKREDAMRRFGAAAPPP